MDHDHRALLTILVPTELGSLDLSQSPWTCRTSHSCMRRLIESHGRLMEQGGCEWEEVC